MYPSVIDVLKSESDMRGNRADVILSPIFEVLNSCETNNNNNQQQRQQQTAEALELVVSEIERILRRKQTTLKVVSKMDVIRLLLHAWGNCDGYGQNLFVKHERSIIYNDEDDAHNYFNHCSSSRRRITTGMFVKVVIRCDLAKELEKTLKDINNAYFKERLIAAIVLISADACKDEASLLLNAIDKQSFDHNDNEDNKIKNNTVERLLAYESTINNKRDTDDDVDHDDKFDNYNYYNNSVEKEMIRVMNRINVQKEMTTKEAIAFSRSLLLLKLKAPEEFTRLLLFYAAENSSNMPLILSAAYNSPGLIEFEYFIRAFKDLLSVKPHLLTSLNTFVASLFNKNVAIMHSDGNNGNYESPLLDPREGLFYIVLPLLHKSNENSVIEFAIHLLRDIIINPYCKSASSGENDDDNDEYDCFDVSLLLRTYPGAFLLCLASIVNSRNVDDGCSERVREWASSTLDFFVDGFEHFIKKGILFFTNHALNSFTEADSALCTSLDWDTRLRCERILRLVRCEKYNVNNSYSHNKIGANAMIKDERAPPSLAVLSEEIMIMMLSNTKIESGDEEGQNIWIKDVFVDIFCISRLSDKTLLQVTSLLLLRNKEEEEDETKRREEQVHDDMNMHNWMIQFGNILRRNSKGRKRLRLALLCASYEVFPRCTFTEIRRIIFSLFPKLIQLVMKIPANEEKSDLDGITFDLFVKVIRMTQENANDLEILARQLANVASTSHKSFDFQLLGIKSLCSALSIVISTSSSSQNDGFKNRAEGALSAAACDILGKIAWESTEVKMKKLQEMLDSELFPIRNTTLLLVKQVRLEISTSSSSDVEI